MTTWAEMKTRILVGLMKDEEGPDQRTSDDLLAYYAKWVCSELAHHTAVPDTVSYACDGILNQFALPNNIIDRVESSALVGYTTSSGTTFLAPIKRVPGKSKPTNSVYWEGPGRKFSLGFTPKLGETISLDYFRTWTPPVDDTDVLEIPAWMEFPFAYLVAAYAMEPIGLQAANIRQWNVKADSGSPEDNPPQSQAGWYIKQAYRILALTERQDRATFFKD